MADKDKKQEPKSWREIIADGIETARSETVATIESAWTGKKVEAERLEYIDLFEVGKDQDGPPASWRELIDQGQTKEADTGLDERHHDERDQGERER